MKNILFLIALITSTISMGQTGVLQINVDINYWDNYSDTYGDTNYARITLKDNNSGEIKYNFTVSDTEILDTTIQTGLYTLNFYLHDSDTVTQIINYVEVKPNSITYVDLSVPRIYYDAIDQSDTMYTDYYHEEIIYSGSLYILSGNRIINNDPNFNNFLDIGFKHGFAYNFAKHFAMVTQLGTDVSFAYINKENTLTSLPHTTERYYYWDLNLNYFLRFNGHNSRSNYDKNVILDIGAAYNLPLAFRHVSIDGNTKTRTRGMHQFTDFSAIVRLGYFPFTFMAEYRLTNFLKDPYHEQPRLKIGIAIIFEEY